MAPRKQTAKTKGTTKAKKLQLNKETLKDLSAKKQVKGGWNPLCTKEQSGC